MALKMVGEGNLKRLGKIIKFIIGSDQPTPDFTYVEKVAHALICAEAALTSHMLMPHCIQKGVFFITNFEPTKS
ncbi:putative 3-beta-hydroxysteroid-4-alpha-carboxylate 3-dehydrogenase (decarboxylating) [Helianthus annuus]|nr:putative 3-beta-hydroxysteroid-4-alpha-carboxylate 3-dehydrogenase (decarboxylating) [Helianthus annuus]KAJ0496874.1 putative 3-beta-hydroxysteroid-4-alpha-carboxylate 3-dehydrogenase (decarboxylating) [Helianthus annuus]KAJ0662905.1 putative 3-beta-hydroxysteroid-4-alpha-carboxylate 3-dehydrogenase (decarboxylating) [Helianthus annuus]